MPIRVLPVSSCCKILRAIAALIIVFHASAVLAAHQYFLHLWQTEDGLPQNAVTAIVQSRDGYLWLGTYSGLARFDGARFVVFDNNNTPELQSSRVTSLFEDDQANLWIGHETGEVTRFHQGRFEAAHSNHEGKARKISRISQDEDGQTWIMNEEGLLTRISDDLTLVPPAGSAPGQLGFAADSDHRIWVARQGKLSKLEHGKLLPVSFTGEPAEPYVQGVCASAKGGVWVASDGRLRRWQSGKWVADRGTAPWGFTGLSEFMETRSGSILAGTVDSGLYIITPQSDLLQFDRTNGLPQNWIRSLCEDREGNLWAGVGSIGMVALREGKVATIAPPDRWQGRAVTSVSGRSEADLWIGTEGAGLYHLTNGRWEQFANADGLLNPFVWAVERDTQNRVWAGTWGGGIFQQSLVRGTNAPFRGAIGLEALRAPCPALLTAKDGTVWIGTDEGLIHYQDAKPERFGESEGLDQPRVRTLAEASDGTLWFGMFGGGLGRLRDGSLKQFRARDGLPSDFVQCLKVEADGAIWIGTAGAGLARLKDGRFSTLTRNHGLSDNVICHLAEDTAGYIWISSHGGIMRISKADLDRCADGKTNRVNCLTYGKGEGMPTLECTGGMQPSGCKTDDGRLWFPTSKGLVVVDPRDVKKNLLPPPVLVEEILVDDQPLVSTALGKKQPAARFEIPPGRHRFEIYYTGLSFTVPEKVRFRYRLEGLESNWTDAGTKRSATFNYLPPGNYTFNVLACNNDEIWSPDGARVQFRVLPFFWQTWWFKVLAGLAAAAAIAGIVLSATRARMKRKLEKLERQRAIERERTRIAKDIHDDLGASLTRITMLSQSARADMENSTAAADLDRIYDTARDMTRAMDEIVWAVNPQHDTLDSLATYLGRFAQGFLASAHVRCRLDVPMQLPSWPLTAEIRHNLFLAFKEALHNAVKHANTSEVHVSVTIQLGGFVLCVDDKGCGFQADGWDRRTVDVYRPGSGNGLANMRQRLAEIGGRCDLKSEPGKGTIVEFSVPVRIAMA